MADYSVSKIDVSDLRKILVQAITNTDFLKQIRALPHLQFWMNLSQGTSLHGATSIMMNTSRLHRTQSSRYTREKKNMC